MTCERVWWFCHGIRVGPTRCFPTAYGMGARSDRYPAGLWTGLGPAVPVKLGTPSFGRPSPPRTRVHVYRSTGVYPGTRGQRWPSPVYPGTPVQCGHCPSQPFVKFRVTIRLSLGATPRLDSFEVDVSAVHPGDRQGLFQGTPVVPEQKAGKPVATTVCSGDDVQKKTGLAQGVPIADELGPDGQRAGRKVERVPAFRMEAEIGENLGSVAPSPELQYEIQVHGLDRVGRPDRRRASAAQDSGIPLLSNAVQTTKATSLSVLSFVILKNTCPPSSAFRLAWGAMFSVPLPPALPARPWPA